MKKFLIGGVFSLSLVLFSGGDQVVLQDGHPCSLTADDFVRIDAIEQDYLEKAASRKRIAADDGQEGVKKVHTATLEALFTSEGKTPIQDRLIELIKQEKKSIRGAEYVFANWPIAKAVARQIKQDGIKAEFLVDRSYKDMHSTNCLISLISDGVKVRVPLKPEFKKLMHDKFLIFEDNNGQKILVTGSYNLSYQANKNDENIIITNDPDIIAQFEHKLDELMGTCRSLKEKVSSQGAPLGSLQSCPASLTLS